MTRQPSATDLLRRRVLLGYCIRRTARDPHAMRGQTMCAYPHAIYPTSAVAFEALHQARLDDALDPRWEYDVIEVWTEVDA